MPLNNLSLAIVIMNYFNEEEVMDFITTEIKPQALQPSVFLVNNGSNNINLLRNFCHESRIVFLDPKKNVGYLGGLILVVDYCLENELSFPKWFILSNSDIEIEDKNTLSGISNKIYPENTAVLGISIISSRNKSNQNPFYLERITLNKLKRLSFIFGNRILYGLYQFAAIAKGILHTGNGSNEIQDVYAVHGSFLFIDGNFLKAYIAEFRQAPLLFGEELIIAEVAFVAKRTVIYDPSYKVLHREHQTTGMFKSKKHLKLLKQSVDYILNQLKRNAV